MKWLKVGAVVFCAVLITALGIDAADTISGSKGTLLSRVLRESTTEGVCPKGMTQLDMVPTLTCVDTYEASPDVQCPNPNPEQMVSTIKNVESAECKAASQVDTTPWRFISRDQAMQMCARAGKRLPTNVEYYALVLSMSSVEEKCNLNSKRVGLTGSASECKTTQGIYDLVGNVWEWTSDDVIDGKYNERQLPEEGYVAQVDATGVATAVSQEQQELFSKDYFWSRLDGAYGMVRGGYYDSGTDGGIYTVHADTLPTTASIGIGFRCVK